MRNALRDALGFAVGGAAMPALETGARRRGGLAGTAAPVDATLPSRAPDDAVALHRSSAMASPLAMASRALPSFPPAPWHPAARVVAAGGGLGLAVAGLSIGGLLALPATLLGLFLVTRAAANIPPLVDGGPDEPHATF